MSEHRFEVEARLEDGIAEALIGGQALRLVSVCLFDGPGVVCGLGEPVDSRPVVSHLRPGEARELAFELLALAELAERDGEAGR
ncbi:MAG: hypothetical protein M3417_11195 [Actinomycetota bacterium]|nr:hypothetical protein [Actinomycetota bacterium]